MVDSGWNSWFTARRSLCGWFDSRSFCAESDHDGWMDVTFRLFTVGGDKEPAC